MGKLGSGEVADESENANLRGRARKNPEAQWRKNLDLVNSCRDAMSKWSRNEPFEIARGDQLHRLHGLARPQTMSRMILCRWPTIRTFISSQMVYWESIMYLSSPLISYDVAVHFIMKISMSMKIIRFSQNGLTDFPDREFWPCWDWCRARFAYEGIRSKAWSWLAWALPWRDYTPWVTVHLNCLFPRDHHTVSKFDTSRALLKVCILRMKEARFPW